MSVTVTAQNHNGANLTFVHREWADRPADQRFYSLESARDAMRALRLSSRGARVKLADLRVQPSGDDLVLTGKSGTTARFNNWSFGQLAGLASAPASYLSTLPAPQAAADLNYSLSKRVEEDGDDELQLLVRLGDGSYTLGAVNGKIYTRLWNEMVLNRIIDLTAGSDWQLPVSRHPMDEGRGVLFASDRDMTVLLKDDTNRVEDGSEGGLMRAVVIRNSEVGSAKFSVWAAYLRSICGNLILWGVERSVEIAFRHVGDGMDERSLLALNGLMQAHHNAPARELEARIERLKAVEFGPSRTEVVDHLFSRKIASRKALESAYTLCESTEPDLNPRSPWGMAQGLTRYSQIAPNFDRRAEVDKAAGKVLDLISF